VFRSIWSSRRLILSLARRQFQVRYRQSLVGIGWAVIPPLATLAAASLVFHEVAGVSTGKTAYGVFTLAGLVPWTFFASSLTFGIPSVALAHPMVTRLAFPRVALPLSMVGLSLVDFAIAGGLFLVASLLTGDGLPITALWLPIPFLVELILITGLVLLGSAANVFARDVRLAVPLAVQLWLFVTPVMYPLSSVPPELRSWYLANPMTGLVESFRAALVGGSGLTAELLLPSTAGALVLFVIGLWYFHSTEHRFADVI
jgi:lipopolysaccharide transport system permease protein